MGIIQKIDGAVRISFDVDSADRHDVYYVLYRLPAHQLADGSSWRDLAQRGSAPARGSWCAHLHILPFSQLTADIFMAPSRLKSELD